MKLNRITALLMLSSVSMMANAASYRVVELPTQNLSNNQFASSIDNTGLILNIVRQPFNLPVDLSLINLDQFNLSDPEAAAQGNFNTNDLSIIISYLYDQTSVANPLTQKLARNLSYSVLGNDVNYISGFDQIDENTGGYTFSQEMFHGDSVNGSHIVGTMAGPHQQSQYITANDIEVTVVVNEFSQRGYVQVGNMVTELAPELQEYGSITNARAINNNLQVAGLSSVSYSDDLLTQLSSCRDDDIRGDEPVEACLYGLRFAQQRGTNLFRASMETRAVVWQLDNNGAVIDKTVYGLLFEPAQDNTRTLNSQASDINNSGVAVGSSSVQVGEFFSEAAVVFNNGEVQRLIADDDLLPNIATNINDNNIVVGYRVVRINGVNRNKMFVVDRNSGNVDLIDGFFVSSATQPRAINNNNIIVGDAESEADNTTRRRSGFMYNIETQEFTDLNTLLACDSPYTIIAGNDINDNNEIVADALVQREAKDVKGESVRDSDGNTILVDTVVSVKLEPTGLAPQDCSAGEGGPQNPERQGATWGIFASLGLLLVALTRRKIFAK